MKTRILVNNALFAVLFIFLLAGCATGGQGLFSGPVILSGYQSMDGARGGTRSGPHSGVDFGELEGAPVLAAADGEVWALNTHPTEGCGKGILLKHHLVEGLYYTAYCHLKEVAVKLWQSVRQGDSIGEIGITGNSGGVPHVHFQVCNNPCARGNADGMLRGTLDPSQFLIGCFDPTKDYAALAGTSNGRAQRLVLTYPVRCVSVSK